MMLTGNMKITINDKRKIFAIQEEFNNLFPFLKIEFYSKSQKQGGASSKKAFELSSKTLSDCRTIHKSGHITVTPQMTVASLEKNFNDVFGLSVQVFRKSGRLWLETTVTDSWTLEDQNHQGELLSKSSAEKDNKK